MKQVTTGWRVCFITVASALGMCAACAAELAVLSAGAIEPGLKAAASAFEKQSGHTVKITFNTAPQLRQRMDSADAATAWDVVIAPPAVIDLFANTGKLATASVDTRANLGRVGLGVALRPGAPAPDISSESALQAAVLAADSLVFNRASTGLYLEDWLKKNKLYAQVETKTTRYPDGASVMEHVLKGQGAELGFGAITEILLYQEKGLRYLGPVPAAMQNYTAYTAAPLASTPKAELARSFVVFLGGPASKALFVAAGIVD